MHPPAVEHPASARLSRRRFVGTSLGVVGSLVASGVLGLGVTSCSSSADDGQDAPLLALGRSLSEGPDGDRLASSLPPSVTQPPVDEASALAALATAAPEVRLDMGEGRTVTGRGWLLAESEAAILVSYARS